MLSNTTRYILFMILSGAFDWFYVQFISHRWHVKHLTGILHTTDNNANAMIIRGSTFIAFYVMYGALFAYLTTDLEDDLGQCTLVGFAAGIFLGAYAGLQLLFLRLYTPAQTVEIPTSKNDTLTFYCLGYIIMGAIKWMLISVILCYWTQK